MKKEWVLLFGTITVTLLVALWLIRWFAPGLLGIPVDLQLVRTAKEVPPFYEGIFRREDLISSKFILSDPQTLVRAKPFYPEAGGLGPNDILGFRNRNVPNVADVIAIGDSQTYGNNAVLENNWPEHLSRMLLKKQPEVYSMAVGGWSAVQYLDMFTNATIFKPKVVIIAFYTGNDPLESFKVAYGMEGWNYLIPDNNLGEADAPKVVFPTPESEWWQVNFSDGVKMTFTPTLRITSNSDHPAVKAGYNIMVDVASRIAEMAKPLGVNIVFTIIPTKELAYALKVKSEAIPYPEVYAKLVEQESKNIKWLSDRLVNLEQVEYVDLVKPLQEKALGSEALYPEDNDGHPISAGYLVIANSLLNSVNGYLSSPPRGLLLLQIDKERYQFILVKDDGVWVFGSEEVIKANGWPSGRVAAVNYRDIAHMPRRGIVTQVDKKRFGPESIE